MSKITLNPELKALLNGLDEQLEVCDESGLTLGRFLPEAYFKKILYAAIEASCPHSEEERERRRHETGGRTLAEIWKRLGVQ